MLVTTSGRSACTGVTIERVETASDMERAIRRNAEGADVVIMAAAVADFRPKVTIATKLRKADGVPELVLEATPDILSALGASRQAGQVLVGFAAETEDVSERALAKLVAKNVDLMVANDVSAPGVGFDHDTNEVTIYGSDGAVTTVPLSTKDAIADAILDRVRSLLSAS